MRRAPSRAGSERRRWGRGGIQHASALVIALALLAGAVAVRIADPIQLRLARELAFDEFQRLAPRPYAPAPVRIVDIDEAALSAVGQWPWPRDMVARLVQRLHDLGAKAIAFDVIFPERDRLSPAEIMRRDDLRQAIGPAVAETLEGRLPDNDRILAAAVEAAPVVLGFGAAPLAAARQPERKASLAFTGADPREILPFFPAAATNLPDLERAARGIGAITLSPLDAQGVVRRIPLLWSDGRQAYPSLTLEILRVAAGERTLLVHSRAEAPHAVTEIRVGPHRIPTTAGGELRIHFTPDFAARYVSAARLLSGDAESLSPLFRGHLVLVGTSAVGLLDGRATPLAETVPGVSIHAQALEQILAGQFLQRPDWVEPFEAFWTVLMGVAVIVVTLTRSPVGALVYGGCAAALTSTGAWIAYRGSGLLLDPFFPSLVGLTLFLALISFRYFVSDRERRFVRNAFARYIAPDYLAQIERDPGLLRLGGEEREITILFLDVRGFTALSEQLSPAEVVDLLNTLFGHISEDILAEGGTIDKYIGDSIMAFWNAPVTAEDHPSRACLAALRIRQTLAQLNARDAFGLKSRAAPLPDLAVGIGLNTGAALVGNMGSDARFNYSVVGDTVNIAARVEGQAKALRFDVVVAEAVARAASGLAFLEAGSLTLRGKAGREKLFILVGDQALASSDAYRDLAAAHEHLLKGIRHRASDWSERLAACAALAASAAPSLLDFYHGIAGRLTDFERRRKPADLQMIEGGKAGTS